MRPREIRDEALDLAKARLNDCEISRRLGIPRGTIRDWRRPRYVKKAPDALCPRCWRPAKRMWFTDNDYAALLGLYVGDGSIAKGPRTMLLRIALDAKYPQIIEETRALLSRCFPANSVDVIRKNLKGEVRQRLNVLQTSAVALSSARTRRKSTDAASDSSHGRRQSWMASLGRLYGPVSGPMAACIWTDGCAFINRTDIHRTEPYEYLS